MPGRLPRRSRRPSATRLRHSWSLDCARPVPSDRPWPRSRMAPSLATFALSPVAVGGISGGNRWLGLAPLAVRPEWQRRGIGSDLVRVTLVVAASRQAELVFVLGSPTYYGGLCFEPAAPLGWRCIYDVPPTAFQVRPLVKPANRSPPGTVIYHTAFDGL